jgi:hypothetical protein
VSVLVVAQLSSEIPEGLMNNPVHSKHIGEGRICSGMSGDLVECNVMV